MTAKRNRKEDRFPGSRTDELVGKHRASGAPLAVAIAGVFAYRFFGLFAVMPFCFAALPALRSIGGQQTAPSHEPAMQPHAGSS